MAFSDAPKCNATAKSTGQRCQRVAVTGSTKCQVHGGVTPKGEASPHFKHGRFSDYLPQRLLKIYDDVQTDEETNILNRNVRLRETFIRERLAMIDDVPDSAETWKQLRDAVKELNKAYRNSDEGKVYGAIADIENIIDERTLYFQAVEEIRIDLGEQRKDKQAIAAIEFKGENAIPATELMTLMGAVLKIIQTVVTDKQQRIQIADGIDNLFSKQTSVIETHE
jgi:hypothetical protein